MPICFPFETHANMYMCVHVIPQGSEHRLAASTTPGGAVDLSAIDTSAPVNRNVPSRYMKRLEQSAQELVRAASNDSAAEWELMFEKPGVVASSRKGNTGAICVKGVTTIPYSIPEIFEVVNQKRNELDTQLDVYQRLKWWSEHTGVEYMRFKPVWPTAARDFCNITQWRLLDDGTLLQFGFSERFESMCQEVSGIVRAELLLGGYVMKAVKGGTEVSVIVQVKGTLPTSIQNMAAQSQPLGLLKLRKVLDKIHQPGGSSPSVRPDFDTPLNTSYTELMKVARRNVSCSGCFLTPDSDATRPQSSVSLEDKEANLVSSAVASKAPPKDRIGNSSVAISSSDHATGWLMDYASILMAASPVVVLVAVYWTTNIAVAAVVALVAAWLALDYIMIAHLGRPLRKVARRFRTLPSGRMVLRFDMDVGRMLNYLESKRDDTSTMVTLTHVVVKAVALTLDEMPYLQGRVVNGAFYPCRKHSQVAVSMSVEVGDTDTAVVTISNADKRSVGDIAKESKKLAIVCASQSDSGRGLNHSFVGDIWASICRVASGKYGIFLPGLFVRESVPFPYGSASVIRMITSDATDAEIDLAVFPDMTDSSCPVTVTIGGVKLIPHQKDQKQLTAVSGRRAGGNNSTHQLSLSGDHKVRFKQMLKVAVCIDSHAASLQQAQRFVSKLKEHMNSPRSLD
ncbi:unnamed protein product [Symbiodinium microadriaticum]|nr:unnamed protein product [Symbiodinium microadriaticum]